MTAPLMTRLAIDRNDERRAPASSRQAAAPVIVRRSIAAAVMLCAGAMLASCAGTSNEDAFSAFVADHWPHWAGGMPSDVPPRPGTPGYNQFIAHGQADQDVLPPANGANTPAVAETPVFQTAPSAPATSTEQVKSQASAMSANQIKPPAQSPVAEAPPQPAADEASVVRGGLY